jgi:hypothetical protein
MRYLLEVVAALAYGDRRLVPLLRHLESLPPAELSEAEAARWCARVNRVLGVQETCQRPLAPGVLCSLGSVPGRPLCPRHVKESSETKDLAG